MAEIKIKRRIRRDPRKEIATFIILLILLFTAFVFTVRYLVKKSEPLSKSAHLKTRSLFFTMRMKKTKYNVGEPIDLLLEVRNICPKPVTLKFDSSLEYDFIIQQEANLLFTKMPMNIWRFSATQGAEKKEHTITLQPQEVKIYKAKWNQKDFNNKQVKAGTYTIIGVINISGKGTELQMRGKMGENTSPEGG